MKDYSDEIAQETSDRTSAWMDEFKKSREYLSLSADQQEQSAFVVGVFAELMYGYHLETPEEWSEGALYDCCVLLFPEKVSAGPEFYEAVEPVLTAFFAFLQRKGYIKNAAELTERLTQVAGRMIENAKSPENWGLAKTLFCQAVEDVEDGVDIIDEGAIFQIFQRFNQQAVGNTSGTQKGRRRQGRK